MKLSIKSNTGFFIVALWGLFLSCANEKKKADVAVSVTVEKVKENDIDYYNDYPGVINPLNEIEIISQVTGNITDLYFIDGQKVKKNQKLYTIDHRQFQAVYNQSVANLNAAKANLGKAQKDADRYHFLLEKDAIARQTVDYALASLETAKMQVKAAEEDVANRSAYLRYSEIKSPTEGTIGFSNVRKGALITAGNTVLNTVSTNDPMAVDFYINEKEVPDFLYHVQQTEKDSLFTILLPNGSVYPFFGHVYAIDRAIDAQTATLKVRLSFSNPSELLKQGMSSTVRMKIHHPTKQKLIPSKALVEKMGEYFVYVLLPDDTVREQKVVQGRTIGKNVIIKTGLSVGERIVLDGVQNLKSGVKVTEAKK